MKKFFKKTEGFTLVELIVVIAILGILAGVGTVGYSGYIKKANEAADKTLLSAATTAINVAAIENRVDVQDLAGTEIMLNADGTIDTTNGPLKVVHNGAAVAAYGMRTGDTLATKINASFKEGFSCDGVKFKFYSLIRFNGTSFDGYEGSTYTYKGQTVVVSQSAIDAYKNSNWGSVESESILTLVGSVSDMATAIDNDVFLSMLEDPDYLAAAASALGWSADEYEEKFGAVLEEAGAAWLESNPGGDVEAYKETLGSQMLTNNTILVAAKGAQTTGSGIIELLTKDDGVSAKESIKTAMASDPSAGLSQAALAYGLYSSYMLEKNPDSFDPDAPLDFSAVMNTMTEADFQTYLTEGNGQKDLDGYLAALNTVNNNTGVGGIGTDILVEGFNNDDLSALLKDVMGK